MANLFFTSFHLPNRFFIFFQSICAVKMIITLLGYFASDLWKFQGWEKRLRLLFIRNKFMVLSAEDFCAIISVVKKSRKAYGTEEGRVWRREQN